eukprot:7352932-Pyramimonas_sp.AAC.1
MAARGAAHYPGPTAETRPGVPFSGVAFNVHFAVPLRAIDKGANSQRDNYDGHPIPPCPNPVFAQGQHDGDALLQLSYVDDLTRVISTANTTDLVDATTAVATNICQTAFSFGLKPHPEKTKGRKSR